MKETRNIIRNGIIILLPTILTVITVVTNTGRIVLSILILIFIIKILRLIFYIQKTYREMLFYERKLEIRKKEKWKAYFLETNKEERDYKIELYDEYISTVEELIELYIKRMLEKKCFLTRKQMSHINDVSEKTKKRSP